MIKIYLLINLGNITASDQGARSDVRIQVGSWAGSYLWRKLPIGGGEDEDGDDGGGEGGDTVCGVDVQSERVPW